MLPTFIIIGAMKCGTTSLHHYLGAHPDVCMPLKKETDFFVAELNYGRGLAWYESLFTRAAKARGEASPHYAKTWRFTGIPERMHSLLPGARLIYLVRDPLQRMISQYNHLYASGLEHRPVAAALAAALDDESPSAYLNDSSYHRNLAPFLSKYSLDQILVLAAEDLQHQRQATLRRVFEFIGVDSDFQSPAFERTWHTSSAKFTRRKTLLNRLFSRKVLHILLRRRWNPACRPLPPPRCELDGSLRRRLIERLAPDISALRRLTGQPFAGWCV
jgi:hypothetical protein